MPKEPGAPGGGVPGSGGWAPGGGGPAGVPGRGGGGGGGAAPSGIGVPDIRWPHTSHQSSAADW
nr:hypothetical protein [Streptomyces varsoviensis]